MKNPRLFLLLVVVAVACIALVSATTSTSTTSSGSSVSSSNAIPPVSSETSSSSTSSPHVRHGHAKTYKISIGSSVSDSSTSDTSDPPALDPIVVDKFFQKSSISADSVYSSEIEANESSTAHIAVEKTQFRKAYVIEHDHKVSSSVMSEIESQFEAFDTIPASLARTSLNLLNDENFHDDEDASLVIGSRFPFQNVQCILPNGTAFPIPNVPCTRVRSHPNLCQPLCAVEMQRHCTPQCFCRAGFNTLTFTEAAIINCTRKFFPAPARTTVLKKSGVAYSVSTVAVPLGMAAVLFMYGIGRKFYGVDPLIMRLAERIRGGAQSV